MPRTYTETLNQLNIMTAPFMEDAVVAVNVDNAVAARMLKKSKACSGGKTIDVPLLVEEDAVSSIGAYGTYDFQPKEITDVAKYQWKRIVGPMALSDMEVDIKNVGTEQLLSLARTKVEQMTMSFKKKFASLLYTAVADLTTTDPDSLIKMVLTKNNTVGGIDASTGVGGSGTISLAYSWNPSVTTVASTAPVTYADLVDPDHQYNAEKILAMKVSALTYDQNDKPTLIICTQGFFNAYEELLQKSRRYDGKAMEVDGGFQALSFRGIPVVVDNNCPGGKLTSTASNYGAVLFLNERYLGYRHHPAMNFRWTKWFKLQNQPVYASHIDWAGSIVCSRRDRQGAFEGIQTDSQMGLT